MRKLVFVMFVAAIGFYSCSEEGILAENELVTPGSSTETFITPLYIAVYNAQEQCNRYELYASANGNIMNVDRQVTILVLDDSENDIIDQAVVTIRAGNNISNKRSIMDVASKEYEDVRLKIGHVSPNDGSTWREIEFFASNCYTKPPRIPKGFDCTKKPCELVTGGELPYGGVTFGNDDDPGLGY